MRLDTTLTEVRVASKEEARVTGERTREREKGRKEGEGERGRERRDGGHVLCIIHAGAFHVYFRV